MGRVIFYRSGRAAETIESSPVQPGVGNRGAPGVFYEDSLLVKDWESVLSLLLSERPPVGVAPVGFPKVGGRLPYLETSLAAQDTVERIFLRTTDCFPVLA